MTELPQHIIRSVVDACTDCDSCRFLLDESCLFFPELYRLWDKEKQTGAAISKEELIHLSQFCTFCGLCACPNIREDVIRARSKIVETQGLPLSARLLADVQNVGKLAAFFPRAVNRLHGIKPAAAFIRRVADIHSSRRLPSFPETHFFRWADEQGLTVKPRAERKVAYFTGCTGAYLFPDVPKAAVSVLKQNGIAVYVPPQQCCGMPTFLEGDLKTTLKRSEYNIAVILEAIRGGFDIVCSCPTCGYFLKAMLSEKAYYSDAYQALVSAKPDEMLIPAKKQHGAAEKEFIRLKKSMYKKILKDDGLFSSLDPLDRITVSEHVCDLGEYLERLFKLNRFKTDFDGVQKNMIYYAPCHQREQNIGTPYLILLRQIPGLKIETVGGALDCCGMGGSLGFKESFHDKSVAMGRPLMEKLKKSSPSAILTDCLSCRLQFQHELECPVYHPVEMISQYLKP